MRDTRQKGTALSPEFVNRITGAQLDLYAFISMLLGNRQDVPDVLQDTNMILVRHAAEYDPARPFLPWARAFAYNQVRAYLKRVARGRLLFDEELIASMAAEESVPAEDSGNAELVFLEECLRSLTPEQRALVEARYYRKESMDSLALRLRRSTDTLYVQLHRIRTRLGLCIDGKMRAAAAEGSGA